MKKYSFHLITGAGKGISYSSLPQVGDLSPAEAFGQAKNRIFYNVTNGNLGIADHALIFPEFKEKVALGYCFNSLSTNTSAWRLPLRSFTPPDMADAKQITFIEADGHETIYNRNGALFFAPGFGDGNPYLQYDETRYQWYWYHPGTQTCEVYNKYGLMVERRDSWGNKIEYNYDPDTHQLDSVVGPSGNRYVIERSKLPDGTLYITIGLIRPGQTYQLYLQGYEFNNITGLLYTSICSINGRDLTGGYKTRYEYGLTDPKGVITKISQDDGTYIQFAYESSMRVQTIYLPMASGSNRTDFKYSTGKVGVTTSNCWKADLEWDSQSRIIRRTQYTGFRAYDLQVEVTQYEYAPEGQLQKIIQPNGGIENFTHSAPFGLLTQHHRPDGQQTDFYYNNGQNRPLLQSTVFTLPGSTTPLIKYSVYERRTNNSINFADETDYLRYEISPEGRVTAYEPTPKGPVQFRRAFLSLIYPSKYITQAPSFLEMQQWQEQKQNDPQQVMLNEYNYNQQGLKFQEIHYASVDAEGLGIKDSQMGETQFTWDVYGNWLNQSKQVLRDGSEIIETAQTTRQFDNLKRQLLFIDALDWQTKTEYAICDDKTYENSAYQVTVTRPNNRIEKTILDKQGDPIYQIDSVPVAGGYSQPRITQLSRDVGGRPIVIHNPDGTTTYQSFYLDNQLGMIVSTSGLVVEYQFDRNHNFECEIHYKNPIDTTKIDTHSVNGDDIKALITLDKDDQYYYRFYDNSHRLCFEVDSKNQATESCYDTLDRLTRKTLYKTPLTSAQMDTLKSGQLISLTPNLSNGQDRCTSLYYDRDKIKMGEVDSDGWVSENVLDNGARIAKQIRYSTRNLSSTRSSDFNAMRPVSADGDAVSYYFYNARAQNIITVDAGQFATAINYYASEKVFQTIRYYNKVDENWFKNPEVLPPMPVKNSEDLLTTLEYDLLERSVNVYASNGVAKATQYTNMGKICLERSYDSRFSGVEGNLNPDQTRTVQKRYDGWDQVIQTANAMISQLLAETTDTQKQQEIWDNSTLRDQYDDVTALKLKSTDTLNRTLIFYYDQERRLILSISPMGIATQLFYNSFNKIITNRRYFNKIASTDLAQLTGGFMQNSVLALLQENATQDIIEQSAYDILNQKIQTIDADNYQSNYTFSRFGEIVQEDLPVQNKTPSLRRLHSFNNRGNEILTQSITDSGETLSINQDFENLYGKLTLHVDETGAVTRYGYDRLGNQTLVIDALNNSRVYTYDSRNRILTDTDALEQVTTYQYNQSLRTLTEIPPELNTQAIHETNIFKEKIKHTDALSQTRTTEHGPDGQVTRTVNEIGCEILDQYDTESQHTLHTDPMDTQIVFTYNLDGFVLSETRHSDQYKDLVTQYIRDSFGRAAGIIDPRGILKQQTFNQRSLITVEIRDFGTENNPGLRLTIQSAYNGQRTKITSTSGDDKNSQRYAVSFQQDGFNRDNGKIVDPTSITGGGALNLTSQLKHDQASRVIRQMDPAGRITYLFYDGLGHQRFSVNDIGAINECQYDSLGLKNLVRDYVNFVDTQKITDSSTLTDMITLAAAVADNQDSIVYIYCDGNHREKYRVVTLVDAITENRTGFVTEMVYDGVGHRIQVIGYATAIAANNIGGLSTAQLRALIVADIQNDRVTGYVFDGAGQERFILHPFDSTHGTLVEKRYDKQGRMNTEIRYANLIDNPFMLSGINEQEMIDYMVDEKIADITQDQFNFSVFNLFNKPDYTVKTIIEQQCAVTQYQHNENGELIYTCKFVNTINFTSFDELPQQISQLQPDPKLDKISQFSLDTCDRIGSVTDPLGNQDLYVRDSIDNILQHQDRGGNITQNSFDRAKRMIQQLTPASMIGSISQNSNGLLVADSKNRAVKTLNVYDSADNLIEKTVDAEGTDPRSSKMTFSVINQLTSTSAENIEVDDPSKIASLSIRPVKTQTISNKTVFNAFNKEIVSISAQNGMKFQVYDSAGRKIFNIDPEKGVIGYTCNNFGDVILETKYAIPLTMNLTPYAQTGIPLSVLLKNLEESLDDRYTYYDRNLCGDPVNIITGIDKPNTLKLEYFAGKKFYFHPELGEYGYYFGQNILKYNAFKKITANSELVAGSGLWSITYQWENTLNKIEAKVIQVRSSLQSQSLFRIERYQYNAHGNEIKKTKYAAYMNISPDGMTLSQLDAYAQAHTVPGKDRIKQKTYDPRGLLLTKLKVGVTRESNQNYPLTFDAYSNITLTTSFDYNKTESMTRITHESLPGDTTPPKQEYFYFDARGFMMMQTGVMFTTKKTVPGADVTITPLMSYTVNAHGQRLSKLAYINGATGVSLSAPPQPLAPDSKNDCIELKMYDNRGKEIINQDSNDHQNFITYTATGQLARSYGALTNTNGTHIDEKRMGYDLCDRVVLQKILRDNSNNVVTMLRHNSFGETIQEGPGDSLEIKHEKDIKLGPQAYWRLESKEKYGEMTPTEQYPLYRKMDPCGKIYNTNDPSNDNSSNRQASDTVSVYDLRGARTGVIRSKTIDLSETNLEDLSGLLQTSYQEAERTEYWLDLNKRLLKEQRAQYNLGPASQPFYLPSEFLISDFYPSLGALSISWLYYVTNGVPVFALAPAGSGDAKTMTVKTDSTSGRCGVDISALQTGVYDLQMQFFLLNPSTGQPDYTKPMISTYGRIYFVTAQNNKSTDVVAYVKDDHTVWLAGDVTGLTAINLIDAMGALVKQYTVTADYSSGQYYVDLMQQSSGTYTAQPVFKDKTGVATQSFIINTDISSKEILSREIPAQAKITYSIGILLNTTLTLSIWNSLPNDYQHTPVNIQLGYTAPLGADIFEATLNPVGGVAEFTIKDKVNSIDFLTLSLVISQTESIPIYQNEPPGSRLHKGIDFKRMMELAATKSQQRIEKERKHTAPGDKTVNFIPRRKVYIRGDAVKNFSSAPTIQFKDVSQGTNAVWKSLTTDAATSQGIVANVTLLSASNYPFILPDGDKNRPNTFSVWMGGQVFDGDATPPESKLMLKTGDGQQRQRIYELDTFGNFLSITDSLGHKIVREYNDLDKEIKRIDPPVLAVDANGVGNANFQGVTTTHLNVRGYEIGATPPAGNPNGKVLDEQDEIVQRMVGDGVIEQTIYRDGFKRPSVLLDSRQQQTQRLWDACDNLIRQIEPNNDSQNNNGQPLVTNLTYNERHKVTGRQNPAGFTTRYNYNSTDDIEQRINPLGDAVTTLWDGRTHVRLRETLASGHTQIWTPAAVAGYFGVMQQYQDISGSHTYYTYNQKLEVTQRTGDYGKHGNTARLVVSYDPDTHMSIYSLDTSQLAPGQRLRFDYTAGRLMNVYDDAQGLMTNFDYDAEDNLILVQMARYDGGLIRRVTSTLDALYREQNFFDTMLTGITEYDRNGNRRHRISQIISPVNGQAIVDDNWYAYDTADRTILVDGELALGRLIRNSSKSSSYSITYSQGVRVQEIDYQNHQRSIGIWADGNIASISSTDGSSQSYHYSPDGSVHTSQKIDTDGTNHQDTMSCNPNLFQTSQISYKNGKLEANTTFTPDVNNNIVKQYTVDYSNGQDKPVSYTLTYAYVGLADQFQISSITAVTNDDNGSKQTQSAIYYDSNNSTVGVIHGDDDDGNSKFYSSTYDSLITQKTSFPKKPDPDKQFKYTNYFYTVNNNYLTSFEMDSEYAINMLLNYSSVRNTGSMGNLNLTPSSLSTRNSSIQGVMPSPVPVPKSLHYEQKAFELSGEYVTPVSKIDVQTVPSTHVVLSGESFPGISDQEFGTTSMAGPIAEKNDYVVSDAPRARDLLTLPQYIPQVNRWNNNAPYKLFVDTMLGHLNPKLKFAQPKHHSGCLEMIVLTAIAVVASIAAPEIVFAVAPALMGTLSGIALTGVLAGLIDAGLQGAAVGIGAVRHFSLEAALEVGLSAGIGAAFGGPANLAKLSTLELFEAMAQAAMVAAVTDVSTQILSILDGRRSKLDLQEIMISMGTAAITLVITAKIKLQNTSPLVKMAVADIASTATSTLLGGAVMGGKLPIESAAAQLIGTLAGQAISCPVVQELKKFQPPSRTGASTVFAQSHHPDLSDYHQSIASGQGQTAIQGLPEYAWTPTLDLTPWTGVDFTQDVTTPTSRSLGTSSAKAPTPTLATSTVLPPPASTPALGITPTTSKVATPNSYVATVPTLTSEDTGASSFAKWLYGKQDTWKGQMALYTLNKTQQFLGELASYLTPTAEMNPLISGTNAIYGQDILQNNRPISGWERAFAGVNTLSFFGGEAISLAAKSWGLVAGEMKSMNVLTEASSLFNKTPAFDSLMAEATQIIKQTSATFKTMISENEYSFFINSSPQIGEKVFRIWGDEATAFGRSWTRVDPSSVAEYRNIAGLPDKNTGRFVSEGYLVDIEGVAQRPAISLHGNIGGLDELVVPTPQKQIELVGVYGINPSL